MSKHFCLGMGTLCALALTVAPHAAAQANADNDAGAPAARDYDNTSFQQEVRAHQEREQALAGTQQPVRPRSSAAARQRALIDPDQQQIAAQPGYTDRDIRGPARYDVFPPTEDDRYDFSSETGGAANPGLAPGAEFDPRLDDPRLRQPRTAAEAELQRELALLEQQDTLDRQRAFRDEQRGPAQFDTFPPSQDARYDLSQEPMGRQLPVSPSDINTAPDTVMDPIPPGSARIPADQNVDRTFGGGTVGTSRESLRMVPQATTPRYDVYPEQSGVAPNAAVPQANRSVNNLQAYNQRAMRPQPNPVPSWQNPSGRDAADPRRNWRAENFDFSTQQSGTARGSAGIGGGGGSSSGGGGGASGSGGS